MQFVEGCITGWFPSLQWKKELHIPGYGYFPLSPLNSMSRIFIVFTTTFLVSSLRTVCNLYSFINCPMSQDTLTVFERILKTRSYLLRRRPGCNSLPALWPLEHSNTACWFTLSQLERYKAICTYNTALEHAWKAYTIESRPLFYMSRFYSQLFPNVADKRVKVKSKLRFEIQIQIRLTTWLFSTGYCITVLQCPDWFHRGYRLLAFDSVLSCGKDFISLINKFAHFWRDYATSDHFWLSHYLKANVTASGNAIFHRSS